MSSWLVSLFTYSKNVGMSKLTMIVKLFGHRYKYDVAEVNCLINLTDY